LIKLLFIFLYSLGVDDIIMAANSNFYQNLNEAITHILHGN